VEKGGEIELECKKEKKKNEEGGTPVKRNQQLVRKGCGKKIQGRSLPLKGTGERVKRKNPAGCDKTNTEKRGGDQRCDLPGKKS